MRTIFKYPVQIADQFDVEMPAGASVLSVQVQGDQPQMWVAVDTEARVVRRAFAVRGTGHPLQRDVGRFVGTFQMLGGALVFHLFDIDGGGEKRDSG